MEVTIVARRSDGMILCESWDSNLTARNVLYKLRIKATEAIKSLHSQSEDIRRISIELDDLVDLHVLLKGLLIVAVMASSKKVLNKRLAYVYLDEVESSFFNYLARTLGSENALTGYSTQIQSVQKPFQFVSFDKIIGRIRMDYSDGHSDKVALKLKNSLTELNSIMKKTVEDVMMRGDVLEEVGAKARHLKDESERFKKNSKWLNMQAMLKQYAPLAAIVSFVLIFLQMKFMIFF
eukprot:GHVH01010809.1.p1 GENE.GHVH01010809.1~~GHVH01010809.1.p1  ORF type:complete len:236 (+),score=29.62 GHVH01010809.1:51-758(+)